MCAECGLVYSGHECRSAWGGDRACYESVFESYALLGECVEVRSFDRGLSVAADVGRGIFGEDPQDVGALEIIFSNWSRTCRLAKESSGSETGCFQELSSCEHVFLVEFVI